MNPGAATSSSQGSSALRPARRLLAHSRVRELSISRRSAARLATVLAAAFNVAVLVPQTGYYGRGARTTFTLFLLWLGAALAAGGMRWMVLRQKVYLLLALPFVTAVVVTHLWRSDAPGATFLSVVAMIQMLMAFVVASYHAGCQPARWLRIREWTIVLTALAILPSLGLLYRNPEIARDLMRIGTIEDQFMTDPAIAGLGVGTYVFYTTLAVVIPCWVALAVSARRLRRAVLLVAVGVACVAVALSSFTAATVILVAGVGTSFAVLPLLKKGRHRWPFVVLSAAVLVSVVVAGRYLVQASAATEFVVSKAIRLYEGITGSGLAQGDETGRGEMFIRTFQTFLGSPILGVGYQSDQSVVGGHSSWIDPWAQYGAIGYLTFFVFQILLTRRVLRNWLHRPRSVQAFGAVVCWGAFWMAGFLNPTIFYVLPGVFLFSDCHLDTAPVTRRLAARELQVSRRNGGPPSLVHPASAQRAHDDASPVALQHATERH